jgi:uroporphyrinogen decarboxylase
MNSKERVKTAFAHREPDRVPVFELLINSPVASEIMGRRMYTGGGWLKGEVAADYLSRGREGWLELSLRMFEDSVAIVRELDLDIFVAPFVPLEPAMPEEIEENTWRYTDEAGFWFIIRYDPDSHMCSEVDSLILREGIAGLKRYIEYVESRPLSIAEELFPLIRPIISEIIEERFIIGRGDVGFPSDRSWLPVFLEAMVLEPLLVERYLKAQTDIALPLIEKQVEAGADAILGGDDIAYSHSTLFSPAMFERFYLPQLKRIVEKCHSLGIPYIKHTDGNITPFERQLLVESGIDGYHAIEPRAGMDIGYIKRKYGERLTLLGNVDCAHTLVFGSEEDIEKEVRECILRAAPGGGYVLSSSNTIHSGVPAKNFLAMLDAARRYGRYPIEPYTVQTRDTLVS